MLQASSQDEMDAWKASLLRVGVFPDKGAVEEEGEEGEEVCLCCVSLAL